MVLNHTRGQPVAMLENPYSDQIFRPFALVFGEHYTTRCHRRISIGTERRGKERQQGEEGREEKWRKGGGKEGKKEGSGEGSKEGRDEVGKGRRNEERKERGRKKISRKQASQQASKQETECEVWES